MSKRSTLVSGHSSGPTDSLTNAVLTHGRLEPFILTLEEGEHVHLPRDQLHAFRKASLEEVGPSDCHRSQWEAFRDKYQKSGVCPPVCISVAWDW